jgi:hypothetical protein
MVEVPLSGSVMPDIYTFPAPNAMVRRAIDKRWM